MIKRGTARRFALSLDIVCKLGAETQNKEGQLCMDMPIASVQAVCRLLRPGLRAAGPALVQLRAAPPALVPEPEHDDERVPVPAAPCL